MDIGYCWRSQAMVIVIAVVVGGRIWAYGLKISPADNILFQLMETSANAEVFDYKESYSAVCDIMT